MAKRVQRSARGTPRRSRRLPAIMLVDDQPLVREGLASLIAASCDYAMALATSDIDELVVAAQRDAPAIVLIDAAMPEAFRLARLLAVRCGTTKTILLDESPSLVNLRRALNCNMAGYVTKKDCADDLLAALAEVAGGGRAFPDRMLSRSHHQGGVSSRPIAKGSGPSPALLTVRELEVLARLAEGMRVNDCAVQLGISPNTVDNHKARIMRKLAIHKTVELARFAIRHGIVGDA